MDGWRLGKQGCGVEEVPEEEKEKRRDDELMLCS
jgi:hypothetical protein